MPVPSKAKQQGKSLESQTKHILISFSVRITDVLFETVSTAVGDKVMKDIRPGVPFEPTYIYRLLTLIKSSLSEKVGYATSGSYKLQNHCKTRVKILFFLMVTLFEYTSSGTESARRKCSCFVCRTEFDNSRK